MMDVPHLRGLVVQDLGLRTLPLAVARTLGGWDVRYLNSRLNGRLSRRILRRLSISPVDLESEERIELREHSYDAPIYAAHDLVQSLRLDPVLDYLASRYSDVPHARAAFAVALVKATTADALGTFLTDAWLNTRKYGRAEVLARTTIEATLLRRLKTPAKVRTARQPEVRWDRFNRLVQRSKRENVLSPDTATDSASAGSDSPNASNTIDPAAALVLMVFNKGDTYGSLYAYDHLFSTDPASPLHRDMTALLSQSGGPLNGGGIAAPFPMGGSWITRRRDARLIHRTLREHAGPSVPDRVLSILAHLCAQIDSTADLLRITYPAARVACLMFEIQVPAYLSLAFDVAGIRTVALHERPETAFEHASPVITHTILAGSPLLARALSESWSTAIEVIEPIGMWRTDLLRDAVSAPWPGIGDPAGLKGRRLVVALPYHVAHDHGRPGDPIATAVQTMDHFLTDMTRIADAFPEVFVMVRAKNADWVNDPRLALTVNAVCSRQNMAISTDYASLNESYRLCANADLVVGKATSLLDECLALRIPAVIHDYTQNSRGSRRSILGYLPREIWALDQDELMSRVSFALGNNGSSFRTWWEPHRHRIYGELNDGDVRRRSRNYICALVESRDDR